MQCFSGKLQGFVIEGHISLGNADVLREQAQSLLCKHNLADGTGCISLTGLISCVLCLRLTVVVVEVGLQAVEVVLSVVFVSLIESGAHLLHAEAAVQDSGKR